MPYTNHLPEIADNESEAEMQKKVFIQTFGCQMNVHDSEQMLALLKQAGYEPTEAPQFADLIILNTCSIREKAAQKAYSQIGRFRSFKRENPKLLIGVAGCLAQQLGKEWMTKVPFIDLVIGTHNIHCLPEMIETAVARRAPVVETCFRDRVRSIGIFAPPAKGSISAFVTVMQGCDNYCAYCVVPYLRGREESRSLKSIQDEIERLADLGVKEVTLLGQNVNSYGRGLAGGADFAALLKAVGRIKGIERIRFTTSHPKDLSDDIIRCFSEVETLCEHIHLPVQSGSDSVLARMNRQYTAADYLKEVDKLREMCSNISITSDIIVGFPGETEEDFKRTLALMDRVRFDSVFSFRYSDRTGTAALNFEDKIDGGIKSERLSIVQDLQKKHTMERNETFEGRIEEVLVEGRSKNSDRDMTGRTRTNHIVNFEGGAGFVGKAVPVRIERAFLHSLRGRLSDQREEVRHDSNESVRLDH